MIVTQFRINPLIGTLAMSFVVGGIGAIATHGNLVVVFDHPEFQAFAVDADRRHHERRLDDDRDRDRRVDPAQPDDVRSVRVRDRRQRRGGQARRRPDQHRAGGHVRAERHGGGARRNDRRVAVLSAQASAGSFLTFTVLTGIIVGGTSILGGEGSVQRTVVGCLFVALVANGFNLLGLDPFYQQITLGIILLLAVGTDAWSRRQS